MDQEGEVLVSYVSKTRDKKAALTFMKKALKRHGSPEAITTDAFAPTRPPCLSGKLLWPEVRKGKGELCQGEAS